MNDAPPPLIDIGVNLSSKRLRKQITRLIEQAERVGVTHLVVTGTSLEHSRSAIEMCHQFPQALVCTAGVHPHDASEWNQSSIQALRELAQHDCVRAIGETGLDYNRLFSPEAQQLDAFEQQLQLAVELQKPVFLHQRDAFDAFYELLKHYRPQLVGAVAHCFTDTREALFKLLELDCHIGITGWVCDERRGQALQAIIPDIPLNRLMLETDAPYLLPRDLPDPPKDKINRPEYLPHILQTVAGLLDVPANEVAERVYQTTCDFFALSQH